MSAAERLLASLQEAGIDDTEILPAKTCKRCEDAAETTCRICRQPICRPCLTDHHHEGFGVPAAETW
ncbi:hypothetical protein V2E29_04660 [Streptomyces diastatochromogenes]|uniref:hypothetical protein n=1 Tax=Streptomyces diastatochromogenes TaxID=42236 RepID=UPI002F265857